MGSSGEAKNLDCFFDWKRKEKYRIATETILILSQKKVGNRNFKIIFAAQ